MVTITLYINGYETCIDDNQEDNEYTRLSGNLEDLDFDVDDSEINDQKEDRALIARHYIMIRPTTTLAAEVERLKDERHSSVSRHNLHSNARLSAHDSTRATSHGDSPPPARVSHASRDKGHDSTPDLVQPASKALNIVTIP